MIVLTEAYKNYTLEVKFYKEQKYFVATCLDIYGEPLKTADEAIESCKQKVDKFLNFVPSNLDDLATALEECLVWTSYEDCYMDTNKMEIVLTNTKHLLNKL